MNRAMPPGDRGSRGANSRRASGRSGAMSGSGGLVSGVKTAAQRASLNSAFQPGEPFNPYRMFTGLFIPEALARCPSISAGAKLAWGRLARYAGEDGHCYPTVKTLGSEIGVGDRRRGAASAKVPR
jgi:hypothetical protein